ncbi:RluA family pseudouridine synthase [Alistipes sp. ZOR0009]|uniref:RluA family pseudouridine synthase n=1 Tax=Alistipes sp. ZOR0009 TaxID=1339253 RepID=UPI000647D4E6|nr:RluA family pseudouridine synthase [Alistipes sp. ZOR0009]
MFNFFTIPIKHIELPSQFPSPFHAEPHPICEVAAQQVKEHVLLQTGWHDELQQGKMFGVLVVKDAKGQIGFLAAFSGNLAGKNYHPFFVPPVADLLNPSGFFKTGEQTISFINQQVENMEANADFAACKARYELAKQQRDAEMVAAKAAVKASKVLREERRRQQPTDEERAAMVRQSQHEKAEMKRLERKWVEKIAALQAEYEIYALPIEELKVQRKTLSADLQQRLFDEFQLLNIRGEVRGLASIFQNTVQKVPPGGAGECAGPKLLQYAFLHGFTPVAMAEFWWGSSPKTEIRHHGSYYPACKGKCEPILGHMLLGMEVKYPERNGNEALQKALEVVFEDDWLLVVSKPAGMLSAPGKTGDKSAVELVSERFLGGEGAFLVHRLDMSTSGLLLIAKSAPIHRQLQAQFERRTVKKRYVAILDGLLTDNAGVIDLPISPNFLDRPRQMVDYDHGKPAITRWEVTNRSETQTRVAFYPLTGRTHQLRVHAAHRLGLGCPIAGDELYGTKALRLYLHAEYLEFCHPVSALPVCIEKKAPF